MCQKDYSITKISQTKLIILTLQYLLPSQLTAAPSKHCPIRMWKTRKSVAAPPSYETRGTRPCRQMFRGPRRPPAGAWRDWRKFRNPREAIRPWEVILRLWCPLLVHEIEGKIMKCSHLSLNWWHLSCLSLNWRCLSWPAECRNETIR